ncbi:MAG: hypothetical protein OEX22_03405, partial [Cyclobacteriaceae bacterium]|nr:hypothetical protein [Cyclobacteriaceae bacterium]
MSKTTQHIVKRAKQRWRRIVFVELFFIALSIGMLSHAILRQFDVVIPLLIILPICLAITVIIGFLVFKKDINDRNVLRLINRQYKEVEESAQLLNQNEDELSFIEKLQHSKVVLVLSQLQVKLVHKHRIALFFLLFLVISVLYSLFFYFPKDEITNERSKDVLKVTLSDSSLNSHENFIPIQVEKVELEIRPPYYTNQRKYIQKNWDVSVIDGSVVTWSFRFNGDVENVQLKFSNGKSVTVKNSKGSFEKSIKIHEQGFYELSFTDMKGNDYTSEYHKVEVVKDNAPEIVIEGIPQYSEFKFNEVDKVDFSTLINDDFGLLDARIIATITKGSGESVKFREESLGFDNTLQQNAKKELLEKSIAFSSMRMSPGDELYFYVEARDNRQPKSNISRSETFFLVLVDTASYDFSLEGDLGVDLMPDYFRSQRQIIIDTEKLLTNKTKLRKQEFNSTSNELGFDQKSLRLKYGQFMGEEDDSGIAIQEDVEELEQEKDEDEEGNEVDVLEGFKHDHDNENEHNLVGDHQLNEEGEEEEDPLENYEHNHNSEEIATFLTTSVKGKLRAAMSLMWDAELYLRLYEPQNSLPYQYKALKLIKEIKNHARIYVHRIGFDPPPIKEESRLSGDLDEIYSQYNKILTKNDDLFVYTRQVLRGLNKAEGQFDENQKHNFIACGKEISNAAIQHPGRYLQTLQWVKQLSEGRELSPSQLNQLRVDLFSLLPEESERPSGKQNVLTSL